MRAKRVQKMMNYTIPVYLCEYGDCSFEDINYGVCIDHEKDHYKYREFKANGQIFFNCEGLNAFNAFVKTMNPPGGYGAYEQPGWYCYDFDESAAAEGAFAFYIPDIIEYIDKQLKELDKSKDQLIDFRSLIQP